jgi:hypothetical protein
MLCCSKDCEINYSITKFRFALVMVVEEIKCIAREVNVAL